MNAKSSISLGIAFVLGIVVGAIGLNTFGARPVPNPSRPVGVPLAASWAGGADGGNWLLCTEQPDGKYRCQVYADGTGLLLVDDLFAATPKDFTGQVRPILHQSENEIEIRGARLLRVK